MLAVSTSSPRVVRRIAVGRSPWNTAFHIWVACNVSSSMVVIDPASNAVIQSIEIGLGDGPTEIAFAA